MRPPGIAYYRYYLRGYYFGGYSLTVTGVEVEEEGP